MKVFAVKNGNDSAGTDLAFLLYYENTKKFYIELPEKADPWKTPLILSAFAKRGEYSVNSYFSGLWVKQRVIPPDRQNIAQILRDNGLKTYDEYALLMLCAGRCEQDDYYLVPIDEAALPEKVRRRFLYRVEDVVPLSEKSLLVFFRDGTVRKCDLSSYFEKNQRFSVIAAHPELFARARVQTGGYGVEWDENLSVTDLTLYRAGKKVPLSADDFRTFVSERVINAAEASEILNCSRQYINELVKTGRLHPVKASEKNTLFLRSEVQKLSWR